MAAFTFSATVDSKGRVTVPSRIRNRLDLDKGDRISLALESARIETREVDGFREALELIRSLDSVKSFSYSNGEVEVVLDE